MPKRKRSSTPPATIKPDLATWQAGFPAPHDPLGPAVAGFNKGLQRQIEAGTVRMVSHKVGPGRMLIRSTPKDAEPLSEREQEVCALVQEKGPLTAKEIADALGLTEKTVTNHVVPELKRKRGLLNKRSRGYYFPGQCNE